MSLSGSSLSGSLAERDGARWEHDLNPEQLAAVTHGDGPQLVIAGAGSGKTRVITYRIAWLVEELGVPPRNIVAVTFTNKAAGEMKTRVEELLGIDSLGAFVGTFHRFALGLLRRHPQRAGLPHDFAIFDATDQLKLVRQALELEELSESAFPPRSVHARISAAKNNLVGVDAFEAQANDFYSRRVARVYRRYQGLLRQASAVDFDDMLFWAVELLAADEEIGRRWRQRVEHLLVDEFQDTNGVQLRLVEELVGADGNLTAVGDEDQGIYRWRGAELANILEFESHFPGATVHKLERNYRSTQTILDSSGALVEQNTSRRGKRLWTEDEEGEPIRVFKAYDEGDEARWLVETLTGLEDEGFALSDVAVLVRTHAQTRAIEEELLRRGVPYELVGGVRFYERAEIKDLVAYLRVLRNPRDTHSMLRIINRPPRGIGEVTLEQLETAAGAAGVPLWDALRQDHVLEDFPTRGRNALAAFRDLVEDLAARAEELSLPALLDEVVGRTGYAGLYEEDDPEGQARLENIDEFLSAAQDFVDNSDVGAGGGEVDDLTAFLDHVSLAADIDSFEGSGGISLMTLHSAKGLEFPVVAIGGLEEGLLPHFNSQGELEDVEEERRLLYVGMTRAQRRLFLSCCRRRRIAGRYQDQEESPFLAEIPERYLEVEESRRRHERRSRGVYSFFDRRGDRAGRRTRTASTRGETEGGDGELGAGTRVLHPTLGEGRVLDREGSGERERLVVYFERWGKRKLATKYANLEIL